MSRPKPTVTKALRHHLPRRSRLLLAVSGGIDSVVMLHGCVALSREFGLELAVAHVDHGLRPESASDAAFVQHLSTQFSLPFYLRNLTPPRQGQNIEAWGRAERYSFFAELLTQHEFDLVLTAHNADDNAETLLMRLLANKELSAVERLDPRRRCLRPLLDVPRSEIELYAKEHQLQWREDQTNQDPEFLRNQVRLELLPYLERHFDPRIKEVLSERAEAFAQDEHGWRSLLGPILERLGAVQWGERVWLDRAKSELHGLPDALQWRVCAELFVDKLGFRLGRAKGLEVVACFLGEVVGVELPGGVSLRRSDGALFLS